MKGGKKGELAIVEYLQKSGFRILKTNFRGTGFEIDIIASRARAIYFIEVKFRRYYDGLAWQAEQLGLHKKLAIMRRGARAYLSIRSQAQPHSSHKAEFVVFVVNQAGRIWCEPLL